MTAATTTAEKLFLQIFETKNRIKQQVKQQTDFYSQHLASKLLVDGITPPSWLWNDNQYSDVPKELSKEDIISEILLPHPQPTIRFPSACCSFYNKPISAGDYGELVYGLSKETPSCNKCTNSGNKQVIAAGCRENNAGCTSNVVPELDVSITPLQDETEVKISNIYGAPDQSVARIQRSKSRQKALELRNSGKSLSRSHLNQKNDTVGYPGSSRLSLFSSEQVQVMELINSDVTAGRGGFTEAGVEDCLEDKEKCSDTCVGRISKTSVSSQRPCFPDEAPEQDVSIQSAMVDGDIIAQSNDRSVQQLDDANDSLNVTKHSLGLVHKRTRSQTLSGNGDLPMRLDTTNVARNGETRSICGATEKSQAAKYEVQNSSDAQIILPFPDTHDVLYRQGNFESVISDDLVKDLPANSRSTLNDAGLECLLTKSSSDYLVLMEPKQLFFDDSEECNSKYNSRPTEECKSLEKSPDKVFDTSFQPASSLTDQVRSSDMISEKSFILEREVSTKEVEIHSGSFKSNTNKHDDVQIKKKKSDVTDYSTLNTVAVDLEAMLHVPNLEFTCPANIIEPNVVESLDTDSHVNLYCKGVCESELVHKQDTYTYKGKKKSTCSSPPSESNYFMASDFSHSAKKAVQVSEECLVKVMGTLDPANIIVDAAGQHCVNENQNSSCLGSRPCSGSMSNVSGIEKTLKSSSLGGDDLFTCGSVGSPLGIRENLDVLRSQELQIAKKPVVERNLRYVDVDSWPRSKRRKIQDQETNFFSASPSFRVKKQYTGQMGSGSIKLKEVGDNVKTVPVNESTDVEIYQKMACQLTDGMESLPKLQTEEYALHSEELGEHGETSSSSELGQLGGNTVSNLIEVPARVFQGFSIQEMDLASSSIDARKDSNEEDHQHLLHFEAEDNLANSEGLVKEKSYLGVDEQLLCGSDWSPPKNDMELTGAERMMPELEGFIIDPQTENEEVNIPGHGINFDKLEFPRTSAERASILEQICKSTVMQTPLTQFSSAFKLHGSHKFCHSVPNGLLECLDLRSISALTEDVDDQLRSSYGQTGIDHLNKMSYSDVLSYPGARFGRDSRITYTSPVGKIWERMSLHTGSSEKRLNSNPELTCFTIEEDPSISEENEKASEMTEKIQEDIGSLIDTCASREPLADITEANGVTSISAGEKFVNRERVENSNIETSSNGPHEKLKQELQNYSRNKSEEENNMLPVIANGIKKAKESTSSRFSKASSSKASLKIERLKLSEKKHKQNNIVSNVTSFIPLVQQKQAAAAICTGKRDVKVKALEAAEAAKRLEEKKKNEREMRKEALKLERARMEQENLRQMELNKKKKEEERKKRDADIVAKKRLREEAERKEKERKRKRIEGPRRVQKEEGTLCSQKIEKDIQFLDIDKGDNKIKESDNPLKKSQNVVKEGREDTKFKKPDTILRPDEFTVLFQQAGVSAEACGTADDSSEHEKAMPALDKSGEMDNLIVQKSPEKSYDISPYQCSDDEEEDEEEDIPKKFIPPWASKNCVALVLPRQQGIEPEIIFPPESFCRVDKLILQRKRKE
ncbi:hypothetical protein ACH5RR_027763 [Cinchona calisaya]|uniref:Inner centromere protein ARK-binding domain-containing protein n=1 Tax=Cinchona calisaya TaxID=153742 RepID=A0ABD2YLU4_9GENT